MNSNFLVQCAVALCLLPSSSQSESSSDASSTTQVMNFMEVWSKSFCKPMEKMVTILDEYPDEMDFMFTPPCVPLMRCAGCCNDESGECYPTKTANVTIQLLKHQLVASKQIEMSFLVHETCECRRKTLSVNLNRRPREKGKKKKEKQKSKGCESRCQIPRR